MIGIYVKNTSNYFSYAGLIPFAITYDEKLSEAKVAPVILASHSKGRTAANAEYIKSLGNLLRPQSIIFGLNSPKYLASTSVKPQDVICRAISLQGREK